MKILPFTYLTPHRVFSALSLFFFLRHIIYFDDNVHTVDNKYLFLCRNNLLKPKKKQNLQVINYFSIPSHLNTNDCLVIHSEVKKLYLYD